MKLLITGGAGFIGTNTALYFAKNKQNQITIVDDFSRPGVEVNANYLNKQISNIQIIKCGVCDIKKYISVLKNADAVIHLAGQTAVTKSIQDPLHDFETNIHASFVLLDTIRNINPKTAFIYSSTNKVYGDLDRHKIRKNKTKKQYEDACHPKGLGEEEPVEFISPYGCSKGAFDMYALDFARIYSMNTVVFRQSCIYGPFQMGVEDQGWVAHFSKQILKKKPITIFGDGFQVRDLLYVEDLVEAYDLAIKNIKKVRGSAFNIGGGINNAYSVIQVINLLQKNMKQVIPVSYVDSRLGDQKYFVSANKKIGKELNWKVRTDFKQGLQHMIDWQKKNLHLF
ncbi:GDP-mannose 4,6-dehydratase [Candidatus Roizmanbacteria bacterium]|nr:GDP-mannose 4,6-dehydratase [Candidatus Roizmanbacteria bacterium]